jgi:hypothetical protein
MDRLTLREFSSSKRGRFIEFFVNDRPLSEIIDEFDGNRTSVLDNWAGVFGTNTPWAEIIKAKQLIKAKIPEAEMRALLAANLEEDHVEDVLDQYRAELDDPEVIIYRCAECGDYLCGGVGVTIDMQEDTVTWTIGGSGLNLTDTIITRFSSTGSGN